MFILVKVNLKNLLSEKEVFKLRKEMNIEDMEEKSEFNRIVFFEGNNFVFNLEDLLIFLVEFLGKGIFGMIYKVVFGDVKVIVVKRFKDVLVLRKDFK